MKETVSPGKQEKIVFFFAVVFLFFLYLFTSPTGPTPEDSSEFILVSHFLGLAHPPGYPLYTLLGKLFSFMPWGNPAQKIAALSALCMALSALIWGQWCLRLTKRLLLSTVVILAYGLCFSNWSSAQLVEVYPLHTLLITFTFYLAFILSQKEQSSSSFFNLSFFVGFFLGLSLSNHYPLVVLTLPALLILVGNKIGLFNSLAGLTLGLFPYLYLFFAHHFSDFIFSHPIENLQQFFDYVFRKEYAANDKSTVFSFKEFFQFSAISAKLLFFSFTPLTAVALALRGKKVFSEEKTRRLAVSLSLGILSSFIFLFAFWQPDFYLLTVELFETFHGFSLGCFLILCAFSFHAFIEKITWKGINYLPFLIPLFLLLSNFRPLNRQSDDFGKDYADLIFKSIPSQSLLLTKGDKDAGFLAYFHYLEGERPDLKLVSQVAALLPNKPFDRKYDIPRNKHTVSLLNLISHQLDLGHPTFSVGPLEYFSPDKAPFPLPSQSWGIITEIYDSHSKPSIKLSAEKLTRFLDKQSQITFKPNFEYYRERVISDVCHSLLILGVEHSLFKSHFRCIFLKAQWVHVHQKDFIQADRLFLRSIEMANLTQDSDLAQMGKDFFLNRMKMLESGIAPQGISEEDFIDETLLKVMPIALRFRSCKNPLAPRILDLLVKKKDKRFALDLETTFRGCDWNSLLKKDSIN